MRNRIVFVAAMLLGLGAGQIHAQRIEVSPFIGARFGGGFTAEEPIPGGTRPVDFNIESGFVWGGSVGVFVIPALELEFLYSRQSSALSVEAVGIPKTTLFDMSATQYHGNALFHFGEADARMRPYALIGFGATTLSPESDVNVDSETRYSFGLGGGVKMYFSENAGIRAQFRFTPTYVSSEPELFCYFYCYVVDVADYANQGEFTVGATFKF